MLKNVTGVMVVALAAAGLTAAADSGGTAVLTASNSVDNRLLVFDTAGALVESVPTLGDGGAGGNAGGIAAKDGIVAVVNFASSRSRDT